jgi:hypothetical protein
MEEAMIRSILYGAFFAVLLASCVSESREGVAPGDAGLSAAGASPQASDESVAGDAGLPAAGASPQASDESVAGGADCITRTGAPYVAESC